MAWHLINRVQGACISCGCGSLLQRSTLCTLNVLSVVERPDISALINISEDTLTLSSSCCTHDVCRFQRKRNVSTFSFRRQPLWFVALDFTNDSGSLSILISDNICGVERITTYAICGEVRLRHVPVVVGSESGLVLPGLVPRVRLSPWYIVDLIGRLGLSLSAPVFLGLGPWYVADVERVPDVLGRSDGSRLDLGQLVNWRQRIVPKTVGRELHALRRRPLDIANVQVCLRFVKTDVQCCWG